MLILICKELVVAVLIIDVSIDDYDDEDLSMHKHVEAL
jgi:hypothetical protein